MKNHALVSLQVFVFEMPTHSLLIWPHSGDFLALRSYTGPAPHRPCRCLHAMREMLVRVLINNRSVSAQMPF